MSSLIVAVWKISEIRPIAKANKVEVAVVGGWTTVVQRGLFKVGDKVVYFQPEICLPPEISDELGVTKYLAKNGRVRSAKLAGEYSHGFVIPADPSWPVGKNVADIYKATKDDRVEDAEPDNVGEKKMVPRSIRKMLHDFFDMTRMSKQAFKPIKVFKSPEHLRNFPEIVDPNNVVDIHEKLHGSYSECQYDAHGNFVVSSKNTVKAIPQQFVPRFKTRSKTLNALQKVAGIGHWINDEEKMRQCRWFRVYFDTRESAKTLFNLIPNISRLTYSGEVVGPGVQKLTYGQETYQWYNFGVYADKELMNNLPIKVSYKKVPHLYSGSCPSHETLKDMSQGNTMVAGDHIREGIVITLRSWQDKDANRMYKLVSDQYLLWNS